MEHLLGKDLDVAPHQRGKKLSVRTKRERLTSLCRSLVFPFRPCPLAVPDFQLAFIGAGRQTAIGRKRNRPDGMGLDRDEICQVAPGNTPLIFQTRGNPRRFGLRRNGCLQNEIFRGVFPPPPSAE